MRKMSDDAQDKKAMKGMKPFQKAAFKKADKVMDKKKPSPAKDALLDAKLAGRVKRMKK